MKKYVFTLAAAVCLAACGGPSDAKEASIDLVKGFFDGDIEKFQAYLPGEPKDKLARDIEYFKAMGQENGGVKSVEVIEVKKNGDATGVKVQVTFANGKTQTLKRMDFYQKDGKWLLK